MKNALFILMAVSIFCAVQSNASDETLEVVQSRGIEQKFILTSPKTTPVASVIMIAGGNGKLNLGRSSSDSVTYDEGWQFNNLVKTRQMYADRGFLVATIDAPSNRRGMNAIWCMSEDHSKDIDAVAKYLIKQANVPVWVIGTSLGSFSAANAGIRLKQSINGIVLTSSITQSLSEWKIYNDYPNGVINMNLAEITVPALVISHKNDECESTPAKNIELLANQFTSSPKVEKIVFSGGIKGKGGPCDGGSPHGYLGIEKDVVEKIASFIKNNI